MTCLNFAVGEVERQENMNQFPHPASTPHFLFVMSSAEPNCYVFTQPYCASRGFQCLKTNLPLNHLYYAY